MFFPIGDEPRSSIRPAATMALIAVNVLVWLALCWPASHQPILLSDAGALDYLALMRSLTGGNRLDLLQHASAYDLLTYRFGFRPAHPSPMALVASLFLHAGWMHLGGNMLFLWIFGANVEERLGPWRFLALYLLGGIFATLFYALWGASPELPLIGASGAISAVLGAYFCWFPRYRVNCIVTLFVFIERLQVPARWMLGFYVLVQNLLPFLLGNAGMNATAYGAHLGGFAAGLGYAYAAPTGSLRDRFRQRAWRRNVAAGQSDRFENVRGGDGFAAAPTPQSVARLAQTERYPEAMAHYRALSSRAKAALDAAVQFALADFLTKTRAYDEALAVLRPLARPAKDDEAAYQSAARANLRMGLIYFHGLARPAAAYPHLHTAASLAGDNDPLLLRAAIEALEAIERGEPGGTR